MASEDIIKKKLAEGNTSAFEELFRMYHNELCHYILAILKDEDEAKEVAQQCFVNLWEKREDLPELKSIKSYLFRAAYNECINRFNHNKIKEKFASEESYYLESVFLADFENTFAPNLGQKIKTAVDTLPRKNKEVFELRYFRGFDTQEVSDQLGITPRTVETHISNAFKLLRDKLKHILMWIVIFNAFM